MPHLSATLAGVRPSPTIAMTTRARQMRAAGRDVITLAAGEPDFDTPRHIREAAKRAIDEGQTRYTDVDGMPALKEAIAEKFRRENGLHHAPSQISVGTGGKQILFNALVATLNPGDEVLIPAPYWVSYPDMVRLAGGTPVVLACPHDAGFRLDPARLEAAITPRTRWLILNSPSNPTGAAYDRDGLSALARVLMRHPHVLVMSDDIYEHLVFDGFSPATIAAVEPALAGRVLTCNGVSKSYAMTGWRIGYAGGPEWLIRAMATVQSQSTSCPASVSQWAALAALTGPQDFLDEWRAVFRRRRDLVVGALNDIRGVECRRPEGAFYVYPGIGGLIGRISAGGAPITDDTAFCMALLEEEGVALVPGAAFGLSPCFRLSYASSDAALTEACERITRFCAGLCQKRRD